MPRVAASLARLPNPKPLRRWLFKRLVSHAKAGTASGARPQCSARGAPSLHARAGNRTQTAHTCVHAASGRRPRAGRQRVGGENWVAHRASRDAGTPRRLQAGAGPASALPDTSTQTHSCLMCTHGVQRLHLAAPLPLPAAHKSGQARARRKAPNARAFLACNLHNPHATNCVPRMFSVPHAGSCAPAARHLRGWPKGAMPSPPASATRGRPACGPLKSPSPRQQKVRTGLQ